MRSILLELQKALLLLEGKLTCFAKRGLEEIKRNQCLFRASWLVFGISILPSSDYEGLYIYIYIYIYNQ